VKTGTVNIVGGEINHGLGWIVLVLGLAAAGLPYLVTTWMKLNAAQK